MLKTFKLEIEPKHLDHSELLEVTIDVQAFEEDDYDWCIDSIYSVDQDKLLFMGEFPLNIQSYIDRRCNEVAYDCSCEAYQEYLEGQADWQYDLLKEQGWN